VAAPESILCINCLIVKAQHSNQLTYIRSLVTKARGGGRVVDSSLIVNITFMALLYSIIDTLTG